jgi:UPF0716 protein FxsA
MAWVYPFLILSWPVIEIVVFFEVVHWIGLAGALAGIVLSGLVGVGLLRRGGLATARRAQAQVELGEMPVDALFDGACLAVAGLLFLLPGFVTDLVALALLPPPMRCLLRRFLAKRVRVHGIRSDFTASGPPVIDGDWQEVQRSDDPPPPPPTALPPP